MKSNIEYFPNPGRENTGSVLAISKKRALELGIRQILVATSHGYTAREAAREFIDTDIEIVAVTISEGYKAEGWCINADERSELEQIGVKVLTTHLSLSGGITESFGGAFSPLQIIANTFYCFSQGVKVAVEIAIMAAEAGYVSTEHEVISIGGSSEGADTAIVLVPTYARMFKDLRIREILCKPRVG